MPMQMCKGLVQYFSKSQNIPNNDNNADTVLVHLYQIL